jgi:hypothetical protein
MPDYIFKGQLADNPLPEILQKINYYRVPGVLTVSSPLGSKEVFLSGGNVIFASSTFDNDRLGEFLLFSGRISPAQYDRSVDIMRSAGKRQGAALVEIGALRPPELLQAVKDQVTAIVWSLFNWTDGDVTFAVGKFKDDEIIKLNLDTRQVILLGIHAIEDPKRIVKWLGRKEEVFEPTDNALALLPSLPLSTEDRQVLRLVDGERNFLTLLQLFPGDSSKAVKSLYALYTLGLLRKKETSIKIVASGGTKGANP